MRFSRNCDNDYILFLIKESGLFLL